MPRVKKLDLGMTALDELFMNDKERAENKLPKIFDIPLSEIDDFPGHPYRVLDDEDMQNLMESIKDRGVITPAMVRKKDDGRYEMISGHRRKHASERLGLETLRCEVVEVSRDEAIILMVDSNAQRSVILPCDKGRAYKMKLEAIKRQGQRTDLTSDPVGPKLERSNTELAEKSGDSTTQIKRYIRLTYLIDELQDFVDKGQMKMRPAVELSYLDEETQRDTVRCPMCSITSTISKRNLFADISYSPPIALISHIPSSPGPMWCQATTRRLSAEPVAILSTVLALTEPTNVSVLRDICVEKMLGKSTVAI